MFFFVEFYFYLFYFVFLFVACRDAAYIAVLTSVLSEAMSSPVLCLETLYENSVALVALEEIIGE